MGDKIISVNEAITILGKPRVGMIEYLDTYKRLLEDPSLVQTYVNKLPNGTPENLREGIESSVSIGAQKIARERLFITGQKTNSDPAISDLDKSLSLISIIFGVNDHSMLYWEIEEGQINVLRDCFKKQVFPLYEKEQDIFLLKKGNSKNQLLCFGEPSIFSDQPDEIEHALYFASQFQIPLGTKEDKVLLNGFKDLLAILMDCKAVKELTFLPGDDSCLLPTYRKS